MSELSKATIETALKNVQDRYQGNDIISNGAVKSIETDAGKVSVSVVLGYAAGEYTKLLKEEIETLLSSTTGE